MAKWALSGQNAPVVSGLRPAWFSHRESTAGADAGNCLGLIWVPTSSAFWLSFLWVYPKSALGSGQAVHMLVNVSV